jgi:hypothetical protein
MGNDAVIDLGVLGGDAAGDAPGASGPHRARVLRRLLRVIVAVATLAGLLCLDGAAAPPLPRLLWTHESVTVFQTSGDIILIHDALAATLTAYRLRDGRPLWHRDGLPHPSFFVVRDGVVVSPSEESSEDGQLVDVETGQPRRIEQDAMSYLATEGGQDEFRILRVWPGTDRREVELVMPHAVQSANDRAERRAAWWDMSGVLHVHDLVTGAELARDTGLRPVPLAMDYMRSGSVESIGDDWLVTRQTEQTVSLAMFAGDDLTPRWRRDLPASDVFTDVDRFFRLPFGCGPTICVQTAEQGTLLLDPATGATVRRVDGEVAPLGDSRWQALVSGDNLTMIDVRTGDVPYPQWHVATTSGVVDGQIFMSRTLRDHVAFAVFDTATGALTRIVTLRGQYGNCDLAEPYLICREALMGGRLGVWRVP